MVFEIYSTCNELTKIVTVECKVKFLNDDNDVYIHNLYDKDTPNIYPPLDHWKSDFSEELIKTITFY